MERKHIKKGLQKEVLFKGLRASYIYYFIYISLATFLLGILLSLLIPTFYSIIITSVLFLFIFMILLFYSKTYGENGFIKKMADKNSPDKIRVSNKLEYMLLWENK